MSKRSDRPTESTLPGEAPPCGPGPLSLLVMTGTAPQEFELPLRGAVTLGRSRGADVTIDHASVSRLHARIDVVDGRFSVRDTESVNGVRVRGRRVAPGESVIFGAGEVIEVGQVSVLVLARGKPGELRESRRSEPPCAVLRDPAMVRLYELARRVGASEVNVLVQGETGVGKELLAEALHNASPRAAHPLVRVNCAALSPMLVESELFGHERGAFTGATGAHPGLMEAANRGTLFLDEVGELPLSLQAKLLRVLEDRQVIRVGSVRARAVDLRFVAATHRDLRAELATGSFRRDLFYRVNGISLTIPPLRERLCEIRPLAEHFLTASASAQRHGPLSPAVIAALEAYDWPGNVRELRNAVSRAALVAGDRAITVADLPDEVIAGRRDEVERGGLRDEVEALERRRIEDALERCHGNQTHAALLLGMPRRTLVTRLKEYGIERPVDRRQGR